MPEAEGRPPDRNPLGDPQVRRPLSLAIERGAIVRDVMARQAAAAGQLLPAGVPNANRGLPPGPHDPEGPRRPLAEAGRGGASA